MTTLGDQLPREMDRVRKVLGHYKEIGREGAFGAAMIEHSLREAEKAMASKDVVAMLRVYQDLRAFKD